VLKSNRKTGKSSKAQFDETRGTNDVSALGLHQVTVISYIKTRQVNSNSNEVQRVEKTPLSSIIFIRFSVKSYGHNGK